jgi:Tfp pilus assembly protein PilF
LLDGITMTKKTETRKRSLAQIVMPIVLTAIWALLISFAFVAAQDPPWLRKMAAWGRKDESFAMKSFGDNFLRQSNYQMAIAHYRKALEIKPDDPGALANLAMAYNYIGESDKGLKILEQALKIESVRPEPIYYNMGEIYDKQGKKDEAITAYLKAVDSELDQDLLYHKLGMAYLATGQLEKAREAFEKALQIQTDPLTPYLSMIRKSLAQYETEPQVLSLLKSIPLHNVKIEDLYKYDLDFIRYWNQNNPKLAGTYSDLAKVCLAMGDSVKSAEYSKLSYEITIAARNQNGIQSAMSSR